MNDSLQYRVTRLVSGSINGFVDATDSTAPETIIAEAIREVDRTAQELRNEIAAVATCKHSAKKRLLDATSKHEELAETLQIAVQMGHDDVAELIIQRQLDLEAQFPILKSALSDATEQETELTRYAEALDGRRHEMESDLSSFRMMRVGLDPDRDLGAVRVKHCRR